MLVGDHVTFKNVPGTVRFVGETKFAGGIWIGVELAVAEGKNNGSINDVQYFNCEANHGVFVRESALIPAVETGDSLVKNGDVSKMVTIVDRLQIKTKTMHQQILSLNSKIEDLENIQLNLNEELELSTIDKETLQEQNELLSQEIQELKESNRTFEAQVIELKKELDIRSKSIKSGSIELISIENAKLFEEVKILQSLNTNLEDELRNIKSKLSKLDDLQTKYNQISKELKSSKLIIEELSSTIETTKQSNSIVENLTLKNLSLAEENNTLKSSIREFEDLKKIENELDKENTELIEQLNHQILIKANEIKDKDSLIDTLKIRIKDLQNRQTISQPAFIQPQEQELTTYNQDSRDLQNSLNRLQTDKQNLMIDLEYLKFKVSNKEDLINELAPDIHNKKTFYSITFQNYYDFIQTLYDLINLNNNEPLVDLLCIQIKFELKQLKELIKVYQSIDGFNSKNTLTNIDELLISVTELIKGGVYNDLLERLVNFNAELFNTVNPKTFNFPNRLNLEKFIHEELNLISSIQQIIELYHHNEFLSLNFKKLFKLIKSYETSLSSSLIEIDNAKQNNNELKGSVFNAIGISDFLNDLTSYAATGNGLNEVNQSLNKLIIDFELRQDSFKEDHLEWENIEIAQEMTNEETINDNALNAAILVRDDDSKNVQIEELKIKIDVLNSKLSNYKQLSQLLNEYKTKNESLTNENETLSNDLNEEIEQNSKYSKIISQSSNSLILHNFEFDTLLEFKQKLDKVELISEIQTLRRTVKYYNQSNLSKKSKNYNWLKTDLPKFKPFDITQNPEIEELRKIGSDMRRRLNSSKSLIA